MLRFPPVNKDSGESPTPRQFAMSMGIEDEDLLDLLEIKTQNDFADRFKVSKDTLSLWNKKLDRMDTSGDLRRLSQRLTKNLMFALYQHTYRKGNPLNFKLWLEFVERWEPKLQLKHNFKSVAKINVKQDVERIAPPSGN